MKKTLFLLTYTPDPRMRKRIRTFLKYNFEVILVFMEREYLKEDSLGLNLSRVYKLGTLSRHSHGLIYRLCLLFGFFKEAQKIIREEKPDVIYAGGFDSLMMTYLGHWHKKSLVFYEVSDLPGGRWRKSWFYRWLIDKLDGVFAKTASFLILTSPHFNHRRYLGQEARIFLYENLPERRIFAGFKKTGHADFTIGYFGLVRQDRPLEALISGLGNAAGIKVLIAGDSVGGSGEAVKKFALGYRNIEFREHYSYEKDILGLYASLDCVYSVYNADNENTNLAMGNKLYEAIACGLPILVTRGSKMAEFVETAGIGFSVDPGNPQEIKDTVLKMVQDRGLGRKIEDNCLAIRNKYYYEAKEGSFMSVVEDLLRGCGV
jgi:glycosyltransferase involved in cell wall biosynthesis